MAFQIHALDPTPFQPLFRLENDALAAHSARWEIVQSCPGYPCRVSLEDAPLNSRVLLINYVHQPATSPYRASHAIYVNPAATRATVQPGQVPMALTTRLLSWRAFDRAGSMLDADVLPGTELARDLSSVFRNDNVYEVHIHNAKPGCFAARATRPDT